MEEAVQSDLHPVLAPVALDPDPMQQSSDGEVDEAAPHPRSPPPPPPPPPPASINSQSQHGGRLEWITLLTDGGAAPSGERRH